MPPRPDVAFPEPNLPVTLPGVAPGTEVVAFYHANRHPLGFRYVRVCTSLDASPLIGLSSGWLRATVLTAWKPQGPPQGREEGGGDAGHVHVRFAGRFHDPLAGRSDGLEMHVRASLVRLAESREPRPLVLLSVLAVRWWDYASDAAWSDYSVTSDGLHRDLVDGRCGVYPELAGEFEMYTAFVRGGADLDRLSEQWAQAALRGADAVAWYLLWPQRAPAAGGSGGSVREQQLFGLCERMERAGVRSGWPHPAGLYRQLCGKLWVAPLSLSREHRVPPTTTVHYADARRDAARAAGQAVDVLLRLRREVWGAPEVPRGELRGVAKLGFSWQGDGVLPFQGPANLARVLARLLEQPGSEQGSCLVQEMVADVACEYRVLCFHDPARGSDSYRREALWLKLKAKGEHHLHQSAFEVEDFALTSAKVLSDREALDQCFGGDWRAFDQARGAADALVERWLLWLAAACSDPVPIARLDFIISRRGGAGGGPAAWTCEVGECGASLCSVECDARNRATLNWAVRGDPGGRFPMPLPQIRRNSGWKS